MRIITLFLLVSISLFGADVQRVRFGMPVQPSNNSAVGFTTVALDTGIKAFVVFQAPETESLSSFLVRYGTRATPATPLPHRVSLQGVTSSAAPTPDGNVLASAIFNSPANNSSVGLVFSFAVQYDASGSPLTSYGVTRGTRYAIVTEACPDTAGGCPGAQTPGSSNTLAVTYAIANTNQRMSYPFSGIYNGAAWSSTVDTPWFGYRTTANTTRGNPVQAFPATTISIAAETATSINLPTTFCSSYKIAGVHAVLQAPVAAKTIKMSLYDGTTVLQTKLLSQNDWRATNVAMIETTHYFDESTLSTLTCGQTYRIGWAPQEASPLFLMQYIQLADQQDRTAFPGGTWFARASRSSCTGSAACNTTTTAWAADSTTDRPMVDLIFQDITEPTGGAGGAHGSVIAQAKPPLRDSLADMFSSLLPHFRSR